MSRPRIHFEDDHLDLEPGLPPPTLEALTAGDHRHRIWERPSFYFGGVHAIEIDPRTNAATSAGDPRRGGAVA